MIPARLRCGQRRVSAGRSGADPDGEGAAGGSRCGSGAAAGPGAARCRGPAGDEAGAVLLGLEERLGARRGRNTDGSVAAESGGGGTTPAGGAWDWWVATRP